jgi:hypothetical protein
MNLPSIIFWVWVSGVICLVIFEFVVTFLTDSDLKKRKEEGKDILIEDVVSKMMPISGWYAGSWLVLLGWIFSLLGKIPIFKGDGLPRRSFQAFTRFGGILAKVYIPVNAERSFKKRDPEKTIYVSKLIIVEFQYDDNYDFSFGTETVKTDNEVFYRNIEYTSETYEPGVSGFPVYLSRKAAVKLL